MYKLAQKMFIEAMNYHIRLLKLDYTKHSATADVYDYFFDFMHEVGEQYEAVDRPIFSTDDANVIIENLYEDIEKFKDSLYEEIKKEKDEWVKNLLLAQLQSIQPLCAKVQSLIKID